MYLLMSNLVWVGNVMKNMVERMECRCMGMGMEGLKKMGGGIFLIMLMMYVWYVVIDCLVFFKLFLFFWLFLLKNEICVVVICVL